MGNGHSSSKNTYPASYFTETLRHFREFTSPTRFKYGPDETVSVAEFMSAFFVYLIKTKRYEDPLSSAWIFMYGTPESFHDRKMNFATMISKFTDGCSVSPRGYYGPSRSMRISEFMDAFCVYQEATLARGELSWTASMQKFLRLLSLFTDGSMSSPCYGKYVDTRFITGMSLIE